jgi:L-alanine-DL-glutamate epimerase-like enolase superfamily enzyme
MLITDVKAHHVRIPFNAGAASFRQGASAIAALDMVIVEVSTDTGLTGWGEIFYMNRAACVWHGQIDADANGSIEVPEGPGLGYEPDKEIMERYRVS